MTGLQRLFGFAFIAAILTGCVSATPPQTAQTASPAPPGWPAYYRWDLVPDWIKWADNTATVRWPADDGCAAAPAPRSETLPVGTLIDRFGRETGSFFSPKGESFASRAMPYVCPQMDYRVYRVTTPLPVTACKAAPWFGEPGGAVQDKTTDTAEKLVASGTLVTVSYQSAGSGGPAPQCARP